MKFIRFNQMYFDGTLGPVLVNPAAIAHFEEGEKKEETCIFFNSAADPITVQQTIAEVETLLAD